MAKSTDIRGLMGVLNSGDIQLLDRFDWANGC
jgi:hypothetical protein